jgi:hypothetical protein
MTASTPTPNSPRELAQRSTDGLDVTLFWRPADGTAYVSVIDYRTETALQFCVPQDAALDAFNHPFAYAPHGLPLTPSTDDLQAPPRAGAARGAQNNQS